MRQEVTQNSKPPQQKRDKLPNKKKDIFFKSAFEDYFADMLRFLYPEADQIFDLEKPITFMDKELLEISPDRNKRGGTRNADMLAKIFLRTGQQELFLLHLEIQTISGINFSSRVFKYWYRISDRYGQPVVSHTIFTGAPSQVCTDKHQYNMLGTKLSFEYKFYQIFQHTEEELLQFDNPFALVVLVAQKEFFRKKIGDLDLHTTRLKIIEKLTANGNYTQQSITRFVLFLNNMIHIENEELNLKFEQRLKDLTGEKITMGIIETEKMLNIEQGIEQGKEIGLEQGKEIGIEQGREQGIEIGKSLEREHFVRNLIITFGFSNEQASKAAEVSLSFVKKIRTQLEKGSSKN